jgi:hypothetical protein
LLIISSELCITLDYKRKNTPCIGLFPKCPIQGVQFI